MTEHAVTVDAAGLEVLGRTECIRLLELGGVGRLAVAGDPPIIRPVNFVLDGERIVVRTGDGSLWRAASGRWGASFEIDGSSNVDHRGWSVIATGRLHAADTDATTTALPLRAWAPRGSRQIRRLGDRRAEWPSAGFAGVIVATTDVDGWGRSARTRRAVRWFTAPVYRHWFRVELDGVEHLPSSGGALLVANHAGAIPVDGALLVHGVETATGRPLYALHHSMLRAAPFVGTALARNGGVVADPDNAVRLLADEGQLVLVFPEGTKGTTKPYSQRYRLQRFGRGGFIEVAMRAGVSVLPVAVTGTEETMPALFTVAGPGGVRLPVTANAVLFGPLAGAVPWPSPIRASILAPVDFDVPPGLDDYNRRAVADAAELVRGRLQDELDRRRRRPARAGA